MSAETAGAAGAAGAARRVRPLEEHAASLDVIVAGERLTCDWSGCLFWRDEATLIVSDLHLEKGSSLACRGRLIPPYDTGATLARLANAVERFAPKRIISLGDSFHDEEAANRLPLKYTDSLHAIMAGREWVWISGNHDPAPPADLGGKSAREMLIGNLILRHEPQAGSQFGEIAGHLHPAGKIRRRDKSVRRPCFATDGTRLIMPSFGAFTGGLNLRHAAFDGLFEQAKMSAILLGKGRVFHIGARALVA
jgi:DNA ligase-associated metallophosphoesterase